MKLYELYEAAQEMKLEEKEGEGEVAVTLLGETVDGRVSCVFCEIWMLMMDVLVCFCQKCACTIFSPMKHPPIHLSAHNAYNAQGTLHKAKSNLLKLISKSNFDLFS